jgi:CheY-like chemotaxis protein/anti-sigma regulatory factor (Ser/Thr protein kinase)
MRLDFNRDRFRWQMVTADPTRLKQVFLNLLSNAVKYNFVGGRVGINYTLDRQGLACICITDTGPGIEPDRLNELFEPFNRLGAESGDIEGTGIGLVITRQLVELMQGELKVDSNPGKGSSFTVCLRAVSTGSSDNESARPVTSSADSRFTEPEITRARILVAEDNLVNQELLADQLAFLGYSADFAATGAEALALWRSGNYPLLLADIRMPEMNGHELIDQIRAQDSTTSNIPIIVATASVMESDIRLCLDSGASEVVSKPLMLDALKQILDKWIPPGPL